MHLCPNTYVASVPGYIDEQTFWIRYFFRVYQIESEEEKRKAILSGIFIQILLLTRADFKLVFLGVTHTEEDFSWEDEEEEDAVTPSKETVVLRPSNETLTGDRTTAPTSDSGKTDFLSVTPANTSPRESSESSFDVVSSGHLSETIISSRTESSKKEKDDEDPDSDWE